MHGKRRRFSRERRPWIKREPPCAHARQKKKNVNNSKSIKRKEGTKTKDGRQITPAWASIPTSLPSPCCTGSTRAGPVLNAIAFVAHSGSLFARPPPSWSNAYRMLYTGIHGYHAIRSRTCSNARAERTTFRATFRGGKTTFSLPHCRGEEGACTEGVRGRRNNRLQQHPVRRAQPRAAQPIQLSLGKTCICRAHCCFHHSVPFVVVAHYESTPLLRFVTNANALRDGKLRLNCCVFFLALAEVFVP